MDQSARACEQVYGGNEGLYLFGKTRGSLIARKEECLSARLFWKGEPCRRGHPFHLQAPSRGSWGKLCSHLARCLHLVWLGGCVPNEGGWGSFCPVFREGWERNQWRWQVEAGAGEHCPGPATRASNPTDFGPLSGPGRSSHSIPILVPTDSPSCGDTPTHTHNPPQDCQT